MTETGDRPARRPATKRPGARAGAGACRADPVAAPADTPAASAATVSPAEQIDALSGDPNFMTSFARGLAVIAGFSQQKRRLTIAQLSHRTGIPRAAVRRCLYTLAKLGFASVEDGRSYSLRPKILSLGHAYLSSTMLATSAQPLLDGVSSRVHESSSIALLEGDDILYVARSSTTQRIMSVDLGIGTRLPASCTSMGRVLLAHLPADALDAYLARVRLTQYTPRTIMTAARLRAELETVRRDGYAIVDQELEIGLRALAVPVRAAGGKVVAAMNIGTQASRVTLADLKSRILPPLQDAARELSQMLL